MSNAEKLKIEDSLIEAAAKPWVDKYMAGIFDGGRYNIFTKEKYEILFKTEELLKMVEYLIEYIS